MSVTKAPCAALAGPRARAGLHARRSDDRTPPAASGRTYLRRLVEEYAVSDDLIAERERPGAAVRWWRYADNFGDLLSPWLIAKMTGHRVVKSDPTDPHYVAIGSILGFTSENSTVWGTGSFGTEDTDTLRAWRRRTPPCAVRCPASG